MPNTLTTIGFDADDTLWDNQEFFSATQTLFEDLLENYEDRTVLAGRLAGTKRRNLSIYGYGIKGFTLSMIETAIDVTDGRVPAYVIAQLLEAGRDMLDHPVNLLPHAAQTVETLRHDYKVLVITKGDLMDQERKLDQSGIRDLFEGVEIVSLKTAALYSRIFAQHGTGVEEALMVGNSMASDVIPMIEAGGWGIYVPHNLTWAAEHADAPDHSRFREINSLSDLPDLIHTITTGDNHAPS